MTQIFNQSFPMLLPRHTSDLFEMFFKDTRDMLNNSIVKRSFSYPQNVFMKAFADGSSEVVLQIALAGFTKDEISVSIENTNLSIEINPKEMTNEQVKDESEVNSNDLVAEDEPKVTYLMKGISRKYAKVTYNLMADFALSEIKSSFKNGILEIHIPYNTKKEVNEILIED